MQPVLCIATSQSCFRLLPLGASGDEPAEMPRPEISLWHAPWRSAEMLDSAMIHRLRVQPGPGSVLLASSWGEGLWLSRDGGRRWSNAPIEIQGSRVHCACVSANGECFVGADHAILKRAGGDLRRWELLDNLWLVPSSSDWSKSGSAAVRDVAVNPRHEEWLLAAVDGAGVLFSSDGGFSWDDARPGTDPATALLLWHPSSPTRALALAPSSLRSSDDGGWSWQDANSPLATLQAAAPLPEDQWLLAGHSATIRGERSELWRGSGPEWTLATRFEARTTSAEDGSEKAAFVESILVVSEQDSAGAGAAWLVGWSDGALDVSINEGRSWRPLLIDGPAPQRARDMALTMAAEEAEGTATEATSDEKARRDEQGSGRFSLDGGFWSSLLDKGQGRT
jgi:hypothetical protein